jgi:hypothetical protein
MAYTYHYPNVSTTVSGTTFTISPTATTATNANITWNGSSLVDNADIKPASLQVHGDAEFLGNLKIQGKNLKESLEAIEDRLAILHPNEELEEKWEQLRGLRKLYMELEAEIIEKEKMWSILKK